MKRRRLSKQTDNIYFEPGKTVECFSSGCTLLDCVLGGGWAESRIANVIGDSSAGKTLLMIEACANFYHKYKDAADIYYREGESAFDVKYAQTQGLPLKNVSLKELDTVESLAKDLVQCIEKTKTAKRHGLYILDSLDSLTDEEEQKKDGEQAGFGMQKAKALSRLFRQMVRKISGANMTVLIVSQIRDNVNAMYGRKTKRAGGRALDFYASQILYLTKIGKVKKVRNGVPRSIGVNIKAECDKNKVGMPHRDCEFPIIYTFGIDDVTAGAKWLLEVKRAKTAGFDSAVELKKYLVTLDAMPDQEYRAFRSRLRGGVKKAWRRIEQDFAPVRRKYDGKT